MRERGQPARAGEDVDLSEGLEMSGDKDGFDEADSVVTSVETPTALKSERPKKTRSGEHEFVLPKQHKKISWNSSSK